MDNNNLPPSTPPRTNLDNDPAPLAPSSPTQPASTVASPPKAAKSFQTMILIVAAIVAAAAGAGGFLYGKSQATPAPATPVKTATVAPATLTVPQGATVLSQCAVGRGTQYALPKDIPTGPVYNVYKGKVIGIEYMVGRDDLLTAGKSFLNLPMFNVKFDHVNIGLLSQGHAGFPLPHYHVDMFTISNAEASAITCSPASTGSTPSSSSSTTTTPTTTNSTSTPSTPVKQ